MLKTVIYLKILVVMLCFVPQIFTIATTPSNRFGIVEGMWFPDVTCELGVGWERIIFDWSQHQPNNADEWHTLNVDDRWLKQAHACDREVVALLKNTPAWATDGLLHVGVPRGLDLPIDDPDNVWANFVRKAVSYYASRGVNHFIILNEPDISSETYGFEFEGELEDYFQMLKVAYLIAKETNPSTVIHLAGTTWWHDVNEGRQPYLERLLEHIQQDPNAETNNFYFDVASLHIYFRSDTVFQLVSETQALFNEYGLHNKEIWVNETNAAPTDDPKWQVVRPQFQLDLEQQASFVVQSAVLGLASGADRIAVYKLWDQNLPPGGESFGILSPVDSSPRPAYWAWQFVTNHFADAQISRRTQTNTVDAIQINHANGQQSLVLWARTATPTQVQVTATNPKAYLLDQYGNVTLLRAQDSMYNIPLMGATCTEVDGCPIGGRVSIMVQPAGEIEISEIVNETQTQLVFE